MNLKERAWRQKLAEMIRALDGRIADAAIAWDDRQRLTVLRERLAGDLGGAEGHSSTPELRSRAATDYAEAAEVLGLKVDALTPPRPTEPKETLARAFDDSFRPAKSKYGDRL